MGLLVGGVEAATNKKAFMKAMQPAAVPEKTLRDGRFMKSILSSAVHVGGRRLNDNGDDAEEDEEEWDMFGFEVADYSIKYNGCQTVKSYSDELAENEESETVLAAKQYIIFRLCPTDYCNKYSLQGCSENYGEYALPMEEYLESVQQFVEERREGMCAYCQACWNADGDDGGRRLNDAGDDAAAADDAVANDDAANDDGEWEYYDEDEDNENKQNQAYYYGEACDEDTCADMYDECVEQEAGDDDQQEEEIDMDEFLECRDADFGDDDGNQYFIGPHCSSDGYTISLAVYGDEECNTYLDGMAVSDIVGQELDTSMFHKYYFPKDCVTCEEGANYWENNENDNDDDDNIAEICENLYMESAKCNQGIDEVYEEAYFSEQQLANEDMVCQFIANLQSGTYDESGEIVIDNSLFSAWHFNFSNWLHKEEYQKEFSEVTYGTKPWQVVLLCLAIVACLVMWVWACCLHGSLSRKNIPWRPRRGKDVDPTDISRQNSGIVMGRSRSGPNASLI